MSRKAAFFMLHISSAIDHEQSLSDSLTKEAEEEHSEHFQVFEVRRIGMSCDVYNSRV
jgi:hypothetical protein